MGGKKKKSAAHSTAPVAPGTSTSAAGSRGSEEPKQQPASDKPTKAAKENKSKGGLKDKQCLGWVYLQVTVQADRQYENNSPRGLLSKGETS